MSTVSVRYKSGNQLSSRSILIWRIVQALVWVVGAVIFTCLIFFPKIGVLLFWNILIPIAPALIVVAVGVWRNVCPLATTALLPRHLGLSKRKIMSPMLQGILSLVSVACLYTIVPLRHFVFNSSGHATAILLFCVASVAVTMGFFYEWKSAWCSSLCPVHPVEKLYGSNVMFALPNAHCQQCQKCVSPCPDSTANISPLSYHKTVYHRIAAMLIVGGLPGFIWGWFHVPDQTGGFSFESLMDIYSMPFLCMAGTIICYGVVTLLFDERYLKAIAGVFAASAVSCYYWYRIPALFGFGKFAGDGLLIDLSRVLPYEAVVAMMISTSIFFFWWIVIRKPNRSSWVVRPVYAQRP